MKKNLPIIIITLILLLTATMPVNEASAAIVSETVNLAAINENVYGDGYTWMNIPETLTLENLNMVTTDEYGFKIPPNATVILKGKNTITAAGAAIYCPSSVIFEGSGSLTLTADDGIVCVSPVGSDSVKITDGKITINAKNNGIYSEYAGFSLTGGTLAITCSESNSSAIRSGSIQLNGGKLTANAPLRSTVSIYAGATELEISANESALQADKGITIAKKTTLSVGENLSSLAAADGYNGEKALKIKPTPSAKKGVLFGGKYHVFWDFATFTLIFAGVCCIIILPIYNKRKKTQRLIEAYRAQNKQTNAASKSEKTKQSAQSSGKKRSGTQKKGK